jgi:hypothetical protein
MNEKVARLCIIHDARKVASLPLPFGKTLRRK